MDYIKNFFGSEKKQEDVEGTLGLLLQERADSERERLLNISSYARRLVGRDKAKANDVLISVMSRVIVQDDLLGITLLVRVTFAISKLISLNSIRLYHQCIDSVFTAERLPSFSETFRKLQSVPFNDIVDEIKKTSLLNDSEQLLLIVKLRFVAILAYPSKRLPKDQDMRRWMAFNLTINGESYTNVNPKTIVEIFRVVWTFILSFNRLVSNRQEDFKYKFFLREFFYFCVQSQRIRHYYMGPISYEVNSCMILISTLIKHVTFREVLELAFQLEGETMLSSGISVLIELLFNVNVSDFIVQFADLVSQINAVPNINVVNSVLSTFVSSVFVGGSDHKWQIIDKVDKAFNEAQIRTAFENIVVGYHSQQGNRSQTRDLIPVDLLVRLSSVKSNAPNALLDEYFNRVVNDLCYKPSADLINEIAKVLDAFSTNFDLDVEVNSFVANYFSPVSVLLNGIAVRSRTSNQQRQIILAIGYVLIVLLRSDIYINKCALDLPREFNKNIELAVNSVWTTQTQALVKNNGYSVIESVANALREAELEHDNLPFLYVKFVESFAVKILDGASSDYEATSRLIERINQFCSETSLNHLFYLVAHERVLSFLEIEPFRKPRGIELAWQQLNSISYAGISDLITFKYKSVISKYKTHFSLIATKIISREITRQDLNNLAESDSYLLAIYHISDNKNLLVNGQNEIVFFAELSKLFDEIEEEVATLGDVINFLRSRRLCPDFNQLQNVLSTVSPNTGKLSSLDASIHRVKSLLSLDRSIIVALKHFVKSKKFSDRFDHGTNLTEAATAEVAARRINQQTQDALVYLKQLIALDNTRINDFNLDNADIAAELRSQGQRQKRLHSELELIVSYFQATDLQANVEINWVQRNERLIAAFTLDRLRRNIPNFLVALQAMNIESNHGTAAVNTLVNQLNGNFFIGDAPALLKEVNEAFGGLSSTEMLFIAKLAADDGLSASRMITFFKRHLINESFEKALQRAQETSRDVHISKILSKLPKIRNLLAPLWAVDRPKIVDVRDHLRKSLSVVQDGRKEAICYDVDILGNVIENWSQCEICFRERGAGQEEKVSRLIRNYQTGRFVAMFNYESDSGSVYLVYEKDGETKVVSSHALELHVQQAVLDGNGNETTTVLGPNSEKAILLDFVKAYEVAVLAQKVVKSLEASGHPDFQPGDERLYLGKSCLHQDVLKCLRSFRDESDNWSKSVEEMKIRCPRLNLLRMKSRICFLLELKRVHLSVEDQSAAIFPYFVQMFPKSFEERQTLVPILNDAIIRYRNEFNVDMDHCAAAISILGNFDDIYEQDVPREELISCLILLNHSFRDIYADNLCRVIAVKGLPAMPSTILFCGESTLEVDIDDILTAAATTVFDMVVVQNVNLLTPRLRDHLLRSLRDKPIKCQVLLVFESPDGFDSFTQFRSEPENLVAFDRANMLRSIWISSVSRNDIFVVAGQNGFGKSHFIDQDIQSKDLVSYKFVINEGFSVTKVLQIYSNHSIANGIALVFSLSVYGNLEAFQRFLHYLLIMGLLVDEVSGRTIILKDAIQHAFYIELPEVDSQSSNCLIPDGLNSWPPENNWNPANHPLLIHVPVISICVRPSNFIKIDKAYSYCLDDRARLVAVYYNMYQLDAISQNVELPNYVAKVSDAEDGEHLQNIVNFFQVKNLTNLSKRVHRAVIDRLYFLCIILKRLRDSHSVETLIQYAYDQHYFAELKQTEDDNNGRGDLVRRDNVNLVAKFATQLHEVLGVSLRSIFNVFMVEAERVNPEHDATGTSLLRSVMREVSSDDDVLSAFDIFLVNENIRDVNLKSWYPSIRNIRLENGVLPEDIRSNLAAIFGIKNSGDVLPLLTDQGFVLTSESFLQVMHIHSRRESGVSLISNGETGCGKSETLKLYCTLMNSDSSLFTNLKLHMLAIAQETANLLIYREEDGKGKEALQNLVELRPSCTANDLTTKIESITNCLDETLEFFARSVMAYFYELFRMFPLHLQCLSRLGRDRLHRFLVWAQSPDHIEESKEYIAISKKASENSYLSAVQLLARPPPEEEGQLWKSLNVSNNVVTDFSLFREEDDDFADVIKQFQSCFATSLLYHRVLVDSSLTVSKWRSLITHVSGISAEIKALDPKSKAVICVFVDELNTAGCLGMVSEAFLSHSIDGDKLDDNIFFVGAINPYRKEANHKNVMDFTNARIQSREENMNRDYLADTPYIVRPLIPGMLKLVTNYRYLDSRGEEYFLKEYFKMKTKLPNYQSLIPDAFLLVELDDFINVAVPLIVTAQEEVRSYGLPRVSPSMRNLIRVVKLFFWYLNFEVEVPVGPEAVIMTDNKLQEQYANLRKFTNIFLPERRGVIFQTFNERNDLSDYALADFQLRLRHSLVMAISWTYMMQLPSEALRQQGHATDDFRGRFAATIKNTWNKYDHSFNTIEILRTIFSASVNHLWSYATIPKGVAKTNAMMENFYLITLSSQTRIAVLLTGPPGCGKTLAYNLVCENLKGECADISLPFRHLMKSYRIPYQCSVTSTGAELSSRYQDACNIQIDNEELQPNKHICLFGIDEAGLIPENRQALKSLHDPLEEHLISITMLSNTTVDAANLSRMIQLLQTQASDLDLKALSWGILVENDTLPAPAIVERWEKQVTGLCSAFININDVIPKNRNWFHSRDFVFLCRMLRKKILNQPTFDYLFSRETLLAALRRHFQTLDPSDFPTLAVHFLEECGLSYYDVDLTSQSLKYVRESLQDRLESMNPTTAHCRYTMIVDPTENESALDLLFSNAFSTQMLDINSTRIVRITDFPDDRTPTKISEVLSQVKRAIEVGATLVLINSAPLQSALYDVINRHYSIDLMTDADGNLQESASARMSVGSYTHTVTVHPDFRLVVLVTSSQLPNTPLPFLNRLEKFYLSVEDTVEQLIRVFTTKPPKCIQSIPGTPQIRKDFLEALLIGMKHFLDFIGLGSAYGVSKRDTVAAILWNTLNSSNSDVFKPQSSNIYLALLDAKRKRDNSVPAENGSAWNDRTIEDRWGNLDMNVPVSFRLKYIITLLNFQILETVRPEYMLQLRDLLPAAYVKEYINNQEHFSAVRLIRSLVSAVTLERITKVVIFTRTDDTVRQLIYQNYCQSIFGHTRHGSGALCQIIVVDEKDEVDYTQMIYPVVFIIHLAAFRSASDCEELLHATLRSTNRVLIVVADMKLCSPSIVTAARSLVDAALASLHRHWESENKFNYMEHPRIIFVLHMPVNYLISQPCYQNVPLNDWSYTYIDSFCDGDEYIEPNVSANSSANSSSESEEYSPIYQSSQITQWLQVAFSLQDKPSELEAQKEFSHLIEKSLHDAIISCNFRQIVPDSVLQRLTNSCKIYKTDNRPAALSILLDRRYLIMSMINCFTAMWGHLIQSTVKIASKRLCQGSSTRGLIACIRSSHEWLLYDFLQELIRKHIAVNWGLETFARLPIECNYDFDSNTTAALFNAIRDSNTTDIGLSAIAIYILRAIGVDMVANRKQSNRQSALSTTISSGKFDRPAQIPMYHSFIALMGVVLKRSLSKSRVSSDKPTVNQREWDVKLFRAVLSSTERYVNVAVVVAIIESKEEFMVKFEEDLIALTLGYKCEPDEMTILRTLAVRFVNIEAGSVIGQNDGIAASPGPFGDVCLWFLRKKDISVHLSDFFRLLRIAKTIEIKFVINHDEDLKRAIVCRSLNALWDLFVKIAVLNPIEIELSNWIQTVRELLGLDIFSLKSLAERRTLCIDDISRFMLMTVYFHYAVISTKILQAYDIEFNEDNGIIGLTIENRRQEFASNDPLVCVVSFLSSILYDNTDIERRHQFDCLTHFFEFPRMITESRGFELVLHGIIGLNPSFFRKFFLGARCEIMRVLLNENYYLVVEAINTIFREFHGNRSYLPTMIMAMDFPYASNILVNSPDDSIIQWPDELRDAAEVIFRSIRINLSSEQHHNDAIRIKANFSNELNRFQINPNFLLNVKLASRIVDFLDMVTSAMLVDSEQSLIAKLDGIDLALIKRAIDIAPRRLSIFVLGRLGGNSVILNDFMNQIQLLNDIGVQLRVPPVVVDPALTRREILQKVFIAQYAHAMEVYHRREEEYELPTKLMLLNSYKNDDPSVIDAANLIHSLISDENISMQVSGNRLKHMLDIFIFVKENFSYRFASVEDAMKVSIDEAFAMLPIATRAEGDRILSQFILSWRELREQFHTFEICHRENPNGGPIPEINDRHQLYLYHLVDVESRETEECYPARMVLQRLLPDAYKMLSSACVNSLIDSKDVNAYRGVLNDFPDESIEHFSPDNFFSGIGESKQQQNYIDNYMRCHSKWRSADVMAEFPNIEQVLLQDQMLNEIAADEAAVSDHYKNIVDNVMSLKCPKCKRVFLDFTGCLALTCVYPECNALPGGACRFCAWCFADCGADAHHHVLNECVHSNRSYYAPNEVFQAHHNKRRQIEIQNIFNGLTPRRQRLLRDKLLRNFAELGINIVIQEGVNDLHVNIVEMPEIVIPNGSYQFDWIAMARYLMSKFLNGRVRYKAQSFFTPLDLSIAEISIDIDVNLEFSLGNAVAQPVNILTKLERDGRAGNIFIRLLYASNELKQRVDFGSVNEIGEELYNRLKCFFSILDEVSMENVSLQIWYLCVELVSLENPHGKTLRDLIVSFNIHSSLSWHTGLMLEIGILPIEHLADVANTAAMIGLEGQSNIVGSELSAPLPIEHTQRQQLFLAQLLEQLHTRNKAKIEDALSELKTLFSVLQSVEENVSRRMTSSPLTGIAALKSFIDTHNYSKNIIADLQVKHFGSILKYIRKVIGIVSYEELKNSFDASSQTAEVVTMETKDDVHVYQPFISEAWMDVQEKVPEDSDLVNPVAHFLDSNSEDEEDSYIPEFSNNQSNSRDEDERKTIMLDDAWILVQNLAGCEGVQSAADLILENINMHIGLAAQLSNANGAAYWEYLQLDPSKFDDVENLRCAWMLVQHTSACETLGIVSPVDILLSQPDDHADLVADLSAAEVSLYFKYLRLDPSILDDVKLRRAWSLVQNLPNLNSAPVNSAAELLVEDIDVHIGIAAQLSNSDSALYWEYLQLDPSKLNDVARLRRAWTLVQHLQVRETLGIVLPADLLICSPEDHVDLTSELSPAESELYWEYVQVDPSKLTTVKLRRAWNIASSYADARLIMDGINFRSNNLVGIGEDEIHAISKKLSHVDSNRFLECFDKFSFRVVNGQSIMTILGVHTDIVTEKAQLGIISDQDLAYVSEDKAREIGLQLPTVPRRKLLNAFNIWHDETVQISHQDQFADLRALLVLVVDGQSNEKLGITSVEDYGWLTTQEVRTLIQTQVSNKNVVPKRKILEILGNFQRDLLRDTNSFKEAWKIMGQRLFEVGVDTILIQSLGVQEAADLSYLTEDELKQLAALFRRLPKRKIALALNLSD